MQVPKELTSLQNLVPDGWAFEGSTDQMPGIWATADHQVGVCCKLVVYAPCRPHVGRCHALQP